MSANGEDGEVFDEFSLVQYSAKKGQCSVVKTECTD